MVYITHIWYWILKLRFLLLFAAMAALSSVITAREVNTRWYEATQKMKSTLKLDEIQEEIAVCREFGFDWNWDVNITEADNLPLLIVGHCDSPGAENKIRIHITPNREQEEEL